jgi:hypothetical protein
MRKTTIAGLMILYIFLISGTVTGEITKDKCDKIKECIDFLWYTVAPECTYMDVYGNKCKEIIKEKHPKNYSKIEECRAIIRSYRKEYTNRCSYIDNLWNNISKETCERLLKEAQETEKQSPAESYLVDYPWTGEVCGKMGMCNLSYEAYKKAINFMPYSQEAKWYYLEIIKCYNIWYEDSNKIKEVYKEFADTVYKFGEYPRFKYEEAANLYMLAEDYEDACKSCRMANAYYIQNNISLLDCSQYGCNITIKIQNENLEQQDNDVALTITIISISIINNCNLV